MEYQTRLETLQEFQQRTCGFTSSSLPSGSMETNPGLSKKVDREGKFLEYQGNTVVFDLPWKVKEKIFENPVKCFFIYFTPFLPAIASI